MTTSSRAGREPLNRAKVLAAAVALADSEGIEAVSMRRLSDLLQVVPMALYKHVSDKDDLLNGMVDAVIAEFSPVPESAGTPESSPSDWVEGAKALAQSARASLSRHPWARRAIETRTVRSAAVLGHMEAMTSVLLAGGLSPDLTHHAMHALGNRIWGFSPELFNDPAGGAVTTPALDPADYPGILAVSADAGARRPDATGCDEDFEFSFALDLILGAVQRLHEAGWSSST